MPLEGTYDHLYSETILLFIQKLKRNGKEILEKEMALLVKNDRFCVLNTFYPLHFVVFEHPSHLGYFNPEFFEIGIHKQMIFIKEDEQLKNLLRHELAHYITFIQYGLKVDSHGKEFHKVCTQYGWGFQVSAATTEVSEEKLFLHSSNVIFKKIQKLLSLATSSSVHESQSATLKANELLLKHNLEAFSSLEIQHEMLLKRILKYKRYSSKMEAISLILRSFFIYPVVNHAKESCYLEVVGEKTNVEIAEYVGHYLDQKLDELWKETQKKYPLLKGIANKNSFFRGLAKGYKEKITALQADQNQSQALLKIENALEQQIKMVYPRLSTTSSRYKHCEKATALGQKEGKNLTIHQGVGKNNSSEIYLLN